LNPPSVITLAMINYLDSTKNQTKNLKTALVTPYVLRPHTKPECWYLNLLKKRKYAKPKRTLRQADK